MKKIILDFRTFFLKPLVYVYFIVSLLLYEFLDINSRGSSTFDTNIYFRTSFMLFFIPTYAIISGILGRVYIKKFYTSFSVFCIFWFGTLFISYSITNPNYSPPIELLFILTAYMAAYAVFYGMTFTISYYFQKRNSGGR